MEEIIDIEEASNEKLNDERIKEYLQKDEEIEKELSEKIEELTNEKNKLSSKKSELTELEDSLRNNLNHDSDTNEIRRIADEIDSLKKEMSTITENVEKLEDELDQIIDAKEKTIKTKGEYAKKVSKTIDEYEKKISLIKAAIEVCENEHLKQAQEEELSKMESELNDMKNKRAEELKETIESAIELKDDSSPKDIIKDEPTSDFNSVDVGKIEIEEDNIKSLNSNIDVDNIEEEKNNVISDDEEYSISLEDLKPSVDFSNLDKIDLTLNKSEKGYLVTDVQSVSPEKVSDIFSSRSIMPLVYDKLSSFEGEIIKEKKVRI